MLNRIFEISELVKKTSPLIHCITNHITIHDCANVILSTGAKPIMAEHKKEVAEITKMSKALCINLGNITDNRMESMLISGLVAKENKIPMIIDLVGIGCSSLRLDFSKELINQCSPNVIKGNMSELKALVGVSNATGIDVGAKDLVSEETVLYNADIIRQIAKKFDTIVVATGVLDIISSKNETYIIKNGCYMLSKITGTGCMLNVLIGSFISQGRILEGCILGTLLMGIAGEISECDNKTGSFALNLMNNISDISYDIMKKYAKLERVQINE